MNFSEAVNNSANLTTTENGAKAYVGTCSKVLDFFSKSGSMRNVDSTDSFNQAYKENPSLALKALLWVRDVRGGAGERKVFRDNLKQLLLKEEVPYTFLDKIPEVGRWDDLFTAFDTKYQEYTLFLIKEALKNNNSLCAKWMPRKGAEAETIRKHLKLSPKQYRKLLVGLTQVVETKMCSQQWESIEYSKVPSQAHNIYKTAFSKHNPKGYESYKKSLTKGEVKINTSTLYPHQVIKSLSKDAEIANAQWEALPNYIPKDSSILPMIDLSGSMSAASAKGFTCADVAIALGLYTATKNTGVFKNLWLNFSSKPKLYSLEGSSLLEYYRGLNFNDWGTNTDINSAFELILNTAKINKVHQADMPKTLMIFSDMQFDEASKDCTNFELAKIQFNEAGYNLPTVVFWNLNSKYQNQPCIKDESGAVLVSGFSPSIMEALLNNEIEEINPEKMMLKVLLKDRYNF